MSDISFASHLVNLPVACFLENVASKSPAPGGGSVAALSGALGAGLGAMVCRLTIGKKKYKDVEAEMRAAEEKLAPLVERMRNAIDEDTFAFNAVMAAFDLPQDTDEQKVARDAAVQKATLSAAAVPLSVMQAALSAIEALVPVAAHGNVNSISDVGVGAYSLVCAFHGARLNVEINLKDLPESEEKKRMLQEKDAMVFVFDEIANKIQNTVQERMRG